MTTRGWTPRLISRVAQLCRVNYVRFADDFIVSGSSKSVHARATEEPPRLTTGRLGDLSGMP
jgi:hypothetical protein